MNSLISFLKNWGDIILSGLVAVGGIFAYFKHDKKLKEQEAKLNELQIKQFEKEEGGHLYPRVYAVSGRQGFAASTEAGAVGILRDGAGHT